MVDDNKYIDYVIKDIKEEFESLKSDFKDGIKEVKDDVKEFRKEVFGNGKKGMCTTRQEALKQWVIESIKISNGLLVKDLKNIEDKLTKKIESTEEHFLQALSVLEDKLNDIVKVPTNIYTWIHRIIIIASMGIALYLTIKGLK